MLFEVSVAVQATVVTPLMNVEPEAGEQAIGVGPSGQLSMAVGANVTTVVQTFESVLFVIGVGQVIAGGCVSFTVTVNMQVALGATPFAAVQLTVVVPFINVLPDAGVHVIVGAGLPVVVTE